MNEILQAEALRRARKLLENLVHYRNGCSHYETDVTIAMRELMQIANFYVMHLAEQKEKGVN